MSELSFLLDLVITEKLTKGVKEKILARVKEIEAIANQPVVRQHIAMPSALPPAALVQSPSTIAAMARHAADGIVPTPEPPAPNPIVTSPVVAVALAERNQHLNQALSGKPEPGRTSPRKF